MKLIPLDMHGSLGLCDKRRVKQTPNKNVKGNVLSKRKKVKDMTSSEAVSTLR